MKPLAALFFFLLLSAPVHADTAQLDSLLNESASAWEAVDDYTAVFYKQEREKGAMAAREKIFLKFAKPFKIYMLWLDTRKQGLQVLYERGKHDNKLAIHKPGLFLVPVIFLPQDSPWVREGSEAYDIEDAGIGTFLEDFTAMVRKGVEEGKIKAETVPVDGGTKADVSFPGAQKNADYFASRVEVFFDQRTKLPVRMSLYDFKGELSGIYEYSDLKLNVAEDAEFAKLAHKRLHKLYFPPAKTVKTTNFSPRSQ